MLKFHRMIGCDAEAVENPLLAEFGIGEAIAAAASAFAAAASTTAAAVGTGITAAEGAVAGGVADAATGLGIGAETAGAIGSGVSGALTGAVEQGALGAGVAALTGGKPLKGLEYGAISGGLTGGISGGLSGGAPTGAGPASAAATAAPASVSSFSPDVTAPSQIPLAGNLTPTSLPNLTPDSTGTSYLAGGNASLPGSVGSGAASGAQTSTAGFPSTTAPLTTGTEQLAPQGSSMPSGGAGGSTSSVADTSSGAQYVGGGATGSDIGGGVKVTPDIYGESFGGSTPGATFGSEGAGGGAPTSVDSFISHPGFGTAFDVLKANPSQALSVASLAGNLIMGNQAPPGLSAIKSEAGQLSAQSGQLESYLNSGQLPPGIQSSVTAAGDAAEASIRSRYASMGLSGSSAEAQDIANAKTATAGQAAQIAMQLYQQGISDAQISTQLYSVIMQQAMEQDKEMSDAIGNFTYAMAGGARPIQPQTTGG